jgi:hypothetical protein
MENMKKTLVLSLNEDQARLVLQSVKSTRRELLASRGSHEHEREELKAVEVMLDAELHSGTRLGA